MLTFLILCFNPEIISIEEQGTDENAHQRKEEVIRKEQRSVQNRIKSARFPVLKSLDDFDYAFQPSIDRKKVGDQQILIRKYGCFFISIAPLAPNFQISRYGLSLST